MGQYSIKDLEQLSGIKAHTIRIWEKRHNIVKPARTESNIRYYSDIDLKRIINVSLLNSHGYKISRIADMSADDVNKKVLEICEQKNETHIPIDQLLIAMIDLDEALFEQTLDRYSQKNNYQQTITDVVYPFLEKIGVLWQAGEITPAHEHFISNLIRQRLILALASLPLPPAHARRAVLFLPEGELHELGLLFIHYLTRQAGFRTYYLGQSVPHNDLIAVYTTHKPHVLITSLTSFLTPRKVEAYLNQLAGDVAGTPVFVNGLLIRNTAFVHPKNIRVFEKATDLSRMLQVL